MNSELKLKRYLMSKFTTPITIINYAGYEIYVKRDDLYPQVGGGNKSRKSDYIVPSVKNRGYDYIVTNGGVNSNHCRAIALKCKEYGLGCSLVLHSPTPKKIKQSLNLYLTQLSGAEICYCQLDELANKMDSTIDELKARGNKPYYLWGGGHCIEGSLAYHDAAKEVLAQHEGFIPDLVFLASGTGTTQAGLIVGFHETDTKVVGISVARKSDRGKDIINNSVQELAKYLKKKVDNEIIFFDDWLYGGYELYNQELVSLINDVAKKTGLILDSTYTAKAFIGMLDYLKSNNITSSSKILFWHTGGLLNLLSEV